MLLSQCIIFYEKMLTDAIASIPKGVNILSIEVTSNRYFSCNGIPIGFMIPHNVESTAILVLTKPNDGVYCLKGSNNMTAIVYYYI